MALLHGRAGRLTAQNGGFWPVQYDATASTFAGVDTDVGSALSVPRVLALFDGEDVAVFAARLAAAVALRCVWSSSVPFSAA
jgi:hypothetical protein